MPRKGCKSDFSGDGSSFHHALETVKVDILDELKNVTKVLDCLQTKMCEVEGTILRVLETQRKQEEEIKALKEDIQRMKDDNTNILAEIEDRDRRKANLIVSGLQEMEEGSVEERKQWDLAKVQALFSHLEDKEEPSAGVSNTFRIGRINSSKPRLLKVVCATAEFKRSLLLKAKSLRENTEYKHVYVNPDLTPSQQAQNKQLREELRRRRNLGEEVIIRHGAIVRKPNFH